MCRISDHLAIITQPENVSLRPKVKRSVKLFHKADFDLINHRFYRHYLESLDGATGHTVNENWVQFKEYVKSVEKLVPNRTVNVNADPPWYNRKLKRLDVRLRKLHQKGRRLCCDTASEP